MTLAVFRDCWVPVALGLVLLDSVHVDTMYLWMVFECFCSGVGGGGGGGGGRGTVVLGVYKLGNEVLGFTDMFSFTQSLTPLLNL